MILNPTLCRRIIFRHFDVIQVRAEKKESAQLLLYILYTYMLISDKVGAHNLVIEPGVLLSHHEIGYELCEIAWDIVAQTNMTYHGRQLVSHYWPFVRGIHQSLVDSPHKGPVMYSFIVSFVVVLVVIWGALILMWPHYYYCVSRGTSEILTVERFQGYSYPQVLSQTDNILISMVCLLKVNKSLLLFKITGWVCRITWFEFEFIFRCTSFCHTERITPRMLFLYKIVFILILLAWKSVLQASFCEYA